MNRSIVPAIIFFCITLVLILLNLFALMNLIPYLITLPLLFISIYLTIYSFFYRKVYKGFKKKN